MMGWREIHLPISPDTIASLKAGDKIMLSGTIYAARDAAHKRFIEALDRSEKLPFDLESAVIYYMGPSPTRPGDIIGSCGPTTSARMDKYTPRLIEQGLARCGINSAQLGTEEVIEVFYKIFNPGETEGKIQIN